MNRSTVSRWMIGGGVAVGLTVAGCAQFVRKPPAGKAPPQAIEPVAPQPRPHLAAARDSQVTVFGELPNRPDVPYFTRTASSMLQHTFAQEGADFDPAISPDGTWMVFSSTRHNRSPDLYYKQIDGIAVTQLTSDPASDVHPVFSPDGRRVAFASNRAGNWDIWMVALDGTQAQQITSSGSDELHPSWSADGKRLVYCSLPPRGQWELWVADATDGGGHKHFFGYGLFPEWSPVGDTILYQRARERGSRWFSVWTVQLVDGEPRYPTEVAAGSDAAFITPSWSVDGTRIAFAAVAASSPAKTDVRSAPQVADIWVVDADGRNRVRLTDGHTANFGPAWSPAGRIFFTSGREGHEAIWSLNPWDQDAPGGFDATATGPEVEVNTFAPARTASDG
jgi:TolB protein